MPDTTEETEPSTRSWWPSVRAGATVWAAAYLAWVTVTIFAQYNRPNGKPVALVDLIRDGWWRFDATVFTRIAEQGYAADPVHPAFFPLYPILVDAVSVVFRGEVMFAAVTVSALALLAAFTLLHRLALVEIGPVAADRTVWALAAWPVAFYLGIGYNASLFLALMLGSVYAMRRGSWWLAGALGGLAACTRSVGLVLVGAFVIEYVRQRRRRPRLDALALLLIPAGLGAYAGWLWWRFGDPLLFVKAQEPWGRELSWPWTAPVRAGTVVVERDLIQGSTLHNLLDLTAACVVLVLLVLAVIGPWRLRRDQLVFPLLGAALLLFAISFPAGPSRNQALMSTPRFALEIFPAFLVLGRMDVPLRVYALVSLMLQGLIFAQFTNGGWVA